VNPGQLVQAVACRQKLLLLLLVLLLLLLLPRNLYYANRDIAKFWPNSPNFVAVARVDRGKF